MGTFEGDDLIVSSYGVASDDNALLFGTATDFVDNCKFTYSSSSDSYTSESGIELTDYFYYPATPRMMKDTISADLAKT